MIETIIPNIFIDLAMGILLYGSITFFHCATSHVFIMGISFHVSNRDLFRWLSEEPYNIILVTPIVFHCVTAAVITAAVSSQINMIDIFIINTIPIAIYVFWQMIESKRYERESRKFEIEAKIILAERFTNEEDLDKILSKIFGQVEKSRDENEVPYYYEIIGTLILISGGLIGKLVTVWSN
ncbi:hypothetical protein [Pseudanabaena sp. UWO310]|uniref:hypothetical protein n=1 Tax=Pseudanabaena sp. UWO310 TaxID=2480795 RepID=UPI001157FFAF|nr:hypothetical protein [Pseudanabaena sp. UWO310]TYQ30884.1 hypothetical protein PseudUWO310_06740 [Pseudanabaena sp. UWO310]